MNNHYGISHTIGLGDINAGIASQNNEIHRINTQRLADFQSGKAKEISNLAEAQKQQAVSAGVEGLSQYINKGQDIKEVGKAFTKLKGQVSGLGEYGISGLPQGAVESVVNPVAKVSQSGAVVADVGEDVAKGGISGAARVAGGALSVGLGAYDLADDISQGKVEGANTLEKIGNVAQVGAGGLEAAAGVIAGISAGLEGVGAAADLTIAAAPIGLALGVVGGVAGGIQEDMTDKTQISKLTPPKLSDTLPEIAAGSTGAEVKEQIQGR